MREPWFMMDHNAKKKKKKKEKKKLCKKVDTALF